MVLFFCVHLVFGGTFASREPRMYVITLKKSYILLVINWNCGSFPLGCNVHRELGLRTKLSLRSKLSFCHNEDT